MNTSRIIGYYTTDTKGPLLFVTAAVHGNEPSGVKALRNVFRKLKEDQPSIKGTFMGLLCNTKAYNRNVRFIDEDLNRVWTDKNISEVITDSSEKREMFHIIDALKHYPKETFDDCYFLDCHTTSSASEPYSSVQVVNDNDEWAHNFPTHIIRGFSDIVSGTIDHYFSRNNITGFVLEAGQHTDKDSVDYHEGTIWIALQQVCGLDFDDLSETPKAVTKTLQKKENRKTFEIVHRHGLKNSDDFKMEPGYENFQPIKKGEVLAIQNGEEVISEWDAYIFMPLYQPQGNDGFFVVDEVSR